MKAFLSEDRIRRLAVALLFGGLSAGATAIAYRERDLLFHFDWARTSGKFQAEPDLVLEQAALMFAETRHPGRACVGKWVGKDERFVYLALGCARFSEQLGESKAEGDQAYRAARLRYSGSEVGSLEQPHPSAYENGLRRLFPKEAADRLRSISMADYLRRGLARMAERGVSP